MITKYIKKQSLMLSAALTAGLFLSDTATAAAPGFNKLAKNVAGGISDLPGLLAALSYMFGVLLGVLGVMKIKDHVENPGQTPLKDGAIRLAAGGALFALPIIYEAMTGTIGTGAQDVSAAQLKAVGFTVK